MAIFQLVTEQFLPVSKETAWCYISSPANLRHITPPGMGFEIIFPDGIQKMYPGMMILYRVKPLAGIPLTWLTEITHVSENNYFVDEQRAGPYSLWHHEHHLVETPGGVNMRDIVTYRLPLGKLGDLANRFLVRKKLKAIFEYRKKALEKFFPAA